MKTATASSAPVTEPAAIRAWAEDRRIHVELTDGRVLSFPANRFCRLEQATEAELSEVKVEVGGYALRWESLDEDITVPGIWAGHFELPLDDRRDQ